MVLTSLISELMKDQILQYYYIVLIIKERAYIYVYIYIYIRGSLKKFPDFFRMGTFIDNTHMKL